MSDRPVTNSQMYERYKGTRNPAMRDWYANALDKRAKLDDSEARIYAGKTHLNKPKAK